MDHLPKEILSNIIGYETTMVRENKRIFKYIQPDTIQSTSFLGQYTEAIFHISQSILKNTYKKRYYNIEKIIYAEKIIFDAKENSRIALYRKMVNRLIPNWDLEQEYSPELGLRFILTNPKQR